MVNPERAAIIAEATCPRSHGVAVCAACWARGDAEAERQERERIAHEAEQLGLFTGGGAVVGGD